MPPVAESGTGGSLPVVLRVTNLSKTFPGTRALQDVNFDVRRGEIHALLGGNGSGKSTLVKVLAGLHHGDPGGTVTVGSTAVPAEQTSPERARSLGLHFVHQHAPVFPDLTVAENLAVGRGFETTAFGNIRWKALRRRTQALLDRFAIAVNPEARLGSLRPAERTMVAIARALQDQEGEHNGVLVLDEPTASLPAAEVDRLMGALARYASAGQTIVFISHRLDEVVTFADRATVLRDGRLAGTLARGELSHDRIVELMTGRSVDRAFPALPAVIGSQVVLSARNLSGGPVRDVSLDVRRGEILGIAGLLGSGRTELLRMLFGAYPLGGGALVLDGARACFRDIGDAMKAGVAYVPEDRPGEAAFLDHSLSENISAAMVSRYWRGGRLRSRSADADARTAIGDFFIRASSEHQAMATLSGGNQQKAILARWLRRDPRVLLLDEPTQGVDVNARAEIYTLVNQAVARGCAVVLVTSDFEELAHVSHRAIVLAGGRIVAEVVPPELDPARLTQLAFTAKELVP